jgi:hypothetical protein
LFFVQAFHFLGTNVQLLFTPLWDADERRKTQTFSPELAKSAFFSVPKVDFGKELHIGLLKSFDA